MTNAEMNRRLATLSDAQVSDILWYIEQGFGARAIEFNTPCSLKQINAVFQKAQQRLASILQPA